jgi:hypothetical protein
LIELRGEAGDDAPVLACRKAAGRKIEVPEFLNTVIPG